jgi:hypothetical protein
MTAVVMPDTVEAVCGWLRGQLPLRGWNVPVVSRVPNPRPAEFVRVYRIGGTRRTDVSDEPMLSVECWSDSEERSADLIRQTRALLWRMPGRVTSPVVYRVRETAGPALLPDPLSTEPRHVLTVLVHVRGSRFEESP